MRPPQRARSRGRGFLPSVPFPSAIEATFRQGNPEGPCAVVDRTATPPFRPLPASEGGGQGGLLSRFAESDLEVLELARPNHSNGLGGADFGLAQPAVQVLEAARRGAVEGNQRIALHQTGLISRALRLDRDDQQAAILLCLRLHSFGQRYFLRPDTEGGAPDTSIGLEAGHHAFGHVHRDRASVAAPEDPAVHSNRAPVDIDQRTATEPGIERRVSLDQVLDLAAAPATPGGRDRTDRPEGRLQAARAADREHDLARLQVFDFG